MRRAALPCVRALQQQAGAEGLLAERLLSSTFAGRNSSQAFQAASTVYNALRNDSSAVRSFVRAYSVIAGRSAVGTGAGAGLSHIARQHVGFAAGHNLRQVRVSSSLACAS